MPDWNLKADWPLEFKPTDARGTPIELFSEPFAGSAVAGVRVSEAPNGVKTLLIELASGVDVLSMVPGNAEFNSGRLTLTTDIFSVAGLRYLVTDRSIGDYPVAWFDNWITAGRIPQKIIYENVSGGSTIMGVSAGDTVGSTTDDPLKIKVKYADSTETEPKFMHPVEFFSLLFWKEAFDPVFNDFSASTAPSYDHPLLQAMMEKQADGTPGTFADDWLGLRPPLRTFERVRWEAIKEHLLLDYCHYWGTWDGESGNPVGQEGVNTRFQNPILHQPLNGYSRWSKCNIYTGEMLFRAGFITIAGIFKLGGGHNAYPCCSSDSDNIQNKLRYIRPLGLNNHPTTFSHGQKIYLNLTNLAEDCDCQPATTATHHIQTPYGNIIDPIDQDVINHFIQNLGYVYFAVSDDHVVIVQQVRSTPLRVCATDHWHRVGGDGCGGDPNDCAGGSAWWSRDHFTHRWNNGTRLIQAIPGGDPTEVWGILNLNRLREV